MSSLTIDSCRQVLAEDETNDITFWPVLQWTGKDFLRRVHKFYIFTQDNAALLFTHELECYAIGSNRHGCLGVGHFEPVTQPIEVVELRGKTVVQCASGAWHVMVLTSEGNLYGWGQNRSGQVGCGNFVNQSRPVLVMQTVRMVACGWSHTVALKPDGTVWCWGRNFEAQLGQGHSDAECTPVQVKGLLEGKRVAMIDCGGKHCVALTDQGHVYHWGKFNPKINTIWSGSIRFDQPRLASPLETYPIVSLVSGGYDFIALTSHGSVYEVYYCNPFNQQLHIECFKRIKLREPCQALAKVNQRFFLKLASGCVAICFRGKVKYTSLTSIADACALYNYPQNTPNLTILPPHAIQGPSHFNNPATSDFTVYLIFGIIYLNRKCASQCSPYLAAQLEGPWRDKSAIEPNVPQKRSNSDYAVWFTWLRYLHTGKVSVIEPWWINQLLALAIETNTPALRDHCLHQITTHLGKDGVTNLVQSPQWSTVLAHLDSSVTIANSGYFVQLAEELLASEETLFHRFWRLVTGQYFHANPHYELRDRIWRLVAKRTHDTAGNIVNALRENEDAEDHGNNSNNNTINISPTCRHL